MRPGVPVEYYGQRIRQDESGPRIEFFTSREFVPARVSIDHRDERGRDAVRGHRVVVDENDPRVDLARKCPEIRHVTRDDDEIVFASIGEDVLLVVGTSSDGVPNVDGEEILLVEVRGHFRIDVLVEDSDISRGVRLDAIGTIDRVP